MTLYYSIGSKGEPSFLKSIITNGLQLIKLLAQGNQRITDWIKSNAKTSLFMVNSANTSLATFTFLT
jgi:hypothetical protein